MSLNVLDTCRILHTPFITSKACLLRMNERIMRPFTQRKKHIQSEMKGQSILSRCSFLPLCGAFALAEPSQEVAGENLQIGACCR